jgi:hypothetical protein
MGANGPVNTRVQAVAVPALSGATRRSASVYEFPRQMNPATIDWTDSNWTRDGNARRSELGRHAMISSTQ